MIARRLSLALSTAFLFPSLLFALDKEEKQWVEGVKPMMLADEEKLFGALKSKEDRAEFQKIFWARRDPDLDTPANELQSEYQLAKAVADNKYRVGGTPGGQTDCGRVVLLMGEPDAVKKDQTDAPPSRRGPETWVFKDRPGIKFKDGQVEIAFDENCALPVKSWRGVLRSAITGVGFGIWSASFTSRPSPVFG